MLSYYEEPGETISIKYSILITTYFLPGTAFKSWKRKNFECPLA